MLDAVPMNHLRRYGHVMRKPLQDQGRSHLEIEIRREEGEEMLGSIQ